MARYGAAHFLDWGRSEQSPGLLELQQDLDQRDLHSESGLLVSLKR